MLVRPVKSQLTDAGTLALIVGSTSYWLPFIFWYQSHIGPLNGELQTGFKASDISSSVIEIAGGWR